MLQDAKRSHHRLESITSYSISFILRGTDIPKFGSLHLNKRARNEPNRLVVGCDGVAGERWHQKAEPITLNLLCGALSLMSVVDVTESKLGTYFSKSAEHAL